MSDFVAEVRPRLISQKEFTPISSSGDFVAEIRPRTQRYSNMDRSRDLAAIDQDLQAVLSDRHFSRESVTRLLEGSILTLIQTILNSHTVSRTEGNLRVSLTGHESPIEVNLNRMFPISCGNSTVDTADPSLRGDFNVKIKNGNMSMPSCHDDEDSFAEGSPFHEFERDPCDYMVEVQNKSLSPSESSRDGEASLSSPPHDFYCSMSSPVRDEGKAAHQFQSSVSETHLDSQRRHESDEESGYTSNDKDDSDAACEHTSDSCKPRVQKPYSTFNDYYCSGFDGKNTLYSSFERHSSLSYPHSESQKTLLFRNKSDEMADDDEEDEDVEFEHKLVIDETAADDQNNNIITSRTKDCSQPMDLDMDNSTGVCTLTRDAVRNALYRKAVPRDCQTEETEDLDSPVSSDITDTDVPVDLSGDSKFSSDVTSANPHPQSLVFKHPGGFMCKQCSHILPDAEAVSSHVQSKHDLYCCTYCCRTFTAKNNLKRHIRIHTGHRPYKCTQCSQSFARRDDLKGHMLRHDYSKPFRCSVCKKGYTDRACVKNHMAKEHRSRLMHVCPSCGESYDNEEAFAAHKRSHPELQQFSCDTCSFIGTNNLMTQKHALLHTHKLFSCKPCNAYFADPFDYTNHVRKHKKLAMFSQYICCFCDLALSTYDQYIRHEYSHAQSKIHTCKTCKTQFKSKSLLQDHVSLHHELDKAGTDVQTCLQMSEIDEPTPVFWQSKEADSHTDCMESTFTDDYMSRCSDFPSPDRGVNMTFQSTPEEEDCDEFQGQLLDLSMKKPSPGAKNSRDDLNNFSSRPRITGLTDQSFPRNGAVQSESFILSREPEVIKNSSRAYHASEAERCLETNCKTNFPMQDSINTNSHINKDWNDNSLADTEVSISSFVSTDNGEKSYILAREPYPTRPRSVERIRLVPDSCYAKSARRQLVRTVSQDCSRAAPLRFSPYSRKKMADLAAKFVAARGTQLFEHRTPRLSVLPTCENRKQAIILMEETDQMKVKPVLSSSRWHLASNQKDRRGSDHTSMILRALSPQHNSAMACQVGRKIDEISREEPNPETALKYHAPIVVKAEPLIEHDQAAEAAYRARFQNVAAEKCDKILNAVNIINHNSASSYGCEDCKEEFGSFFELENHSVEMHKRYLCEHCKKSFTARPNRDRHVRYHTGERPYKCDLCDMAFFRGDDLKYHRTTRHPTAMPFTCTRCSATFTWGRDLDRHIRHSKCKL